MAVHHLHRAVLSLILLYLQLRWIGVDAFGVDVDGTARVPARRRRLEPNEPPVFASASCDLPRKAPFERWGGVMSGIFDRPMAMNPAVALISSCLCLLVVHPEPSFARHDMMPSLLTSVGGQSDLSSITLESIDDLNLKPATDEKPQIKLAESSQVRLSTRSSGESTERKPILQGLVYFPERAASQDKASSKPAPANRQQMDYYSDVLVLTAVSASPPGSEEVLAGAKFPVSRVRFPLNFQMYRENLLLKKPGVKEAWEKIEDTEDVIIRASICPSDAPTFPCENPKRTSQGVAKLIRNIPGLKDGQVIRAPASLQLQ